MLYLCRGLFMASLVTYYVHIWAPHTPTLLSNISMMNYAGTTFFTTTVASSNDNHHPSHTGFRVTDCLDTETPFSSEVYL